MARVAAEFGDDVAVYAVAANDTEDAVHGYIEDVGLTVPVIYDMLPPGPCFLLPDGAPSLYDWLNPRVGVQDGSAPFPLHAIVGADGAFVFTDRGHDPDAILQALRVELGTE